MLDTIYSSLYYFKELLVILIIVRCILTWLPINYNNSFVSLISRLTDPILEPIRRLVYKSPLGGPGMMLDISPVIALFILEGVYGLIGRLLGVVVG